MKSEELNQEAREIFESQKTKVYRSTKTFDGFSTCFRQWRAEGTHCRFLHGYGVSFRVTFVGELDERNWYEEMVLLYKVSRCILQNFTITIGEDLYVEEYR